MPPSARAAETTSTSARAPWGTGSLTPESVQESPSCAAVTPEADGLHERPGSSCAKASTDSPAESAPSTSWRWASLPTAETSPPASTTEVRNGSGAITRPSSWQTMPISTGPAPTPPSSSENGRPSSPISAILVHCFSSKPGSSLTAWRRFS